MAGVHILQNRFPCEACACELWLHKEVAYIAEARTGDNFVMSGLHFCSLEHLIKTLKNWYYNGDISTSELATTKVYLVRHVRSHFMPKRWRQIKHLDRPIHVILSKEPAKDWLYMTNKKEVILVV